MPLLTISSTIGAIGILWNYRQVPSVYVKWWFSSYKEPEVGQVWTKACLNNQNSNGDLIVLKVVKIESGQVWFKTNAIHDIEEEFHERLEHWTVIARDEQYFVLHKPKTTLEDKFWGDAAE